MYIENNSDELKFVILVMENYLSELFSEQEYDKNNFFLIAGPCVVEGEGMVSEISETVAAICKKYQIPYIFKASYKKANRTSASSFTGIGDKEAMEIIKNAGKKISIPTITDIHTSQEAALAAGYVDILQIPAFLCRQTELLIAAAETGKIVNVKKGQFLNGEAMRFAVQKINAAGNKKVMLTERGNSFGYHDLVVDYRNIHSMKMNNVPVIMDCTHSLQQPNQSSGVTGGNPQLIETIAKAAIATGADGLFIETHPNPSIAKSDGANMLPLHLLENLIEKLVRVRKAIL
jgi:2-dehydro-3-deoxyphosphooctonate aldolase (KDO 8-P synthase)